MLQVIWEWIRRLGRQSNVLDETDARGLKYDAEVNINQLLDTNNRNIFGSSDMDGFRAKGFSSFKPTSSPEVAKQVFDFFKSRKSPEEHTSLKTLKQALAKPKEAIRKTKEQVGS